MRRKGLRSCADGALSGARNGNGDFYAVGPVFHPAGDIRHREAGSLQKIDGRIDANMVQIFKGAGAHGLGKAAPEGRYALGAHGGQLVQGDGFLIVIDDMQHRRADLIEGVGQGGDHGVMAFQPVQVQGQLSHL